MWYYTVNNQQAGPVDEAEIKKLVAAGTITAATQVWTNGMSAWAPIGSTPLASLVGSLPPAPPAFAPVAVDKPEVASIKKLFTWYWISLIAILIGIGLPVAMVLFFIIIYKAWKLVQHEGIRGDADKMVSNCFIPGWNFYWYFPAFRGLAKEFNALFDREGMAHERFNLDLPTWMIICIYGSSITFGISLVAFLVLWIMYTVKVKNATIAVLNARG